MSKYRKICPKIWNDEKFRELSDLAKLAFFQILTHPHLTAVGAMRNTIAGLSAELSWEEKDYRKAFDEPFSKGMLKIDEKACFILLPNFIRYNLPENPNVCKAWAKSLDDLPECELKIELILLINQTLSELSKGFGKAFNEALPKHYQKSIAKQEQEQEQEQDKKDSGRFTPPVPQEVTEYAKSINFDLNGQYFCDSYDAKNWMIGKNKMTDWKAAVRTWKHRKDNNDTGKPNSSGQQSIDFSEQESTIGSTVTN